jgi:hypothetical protein
MKQILAVTAGIEPWNSSGPSAEIINAEDVETYGDDPDYGYAYYVIEVDSEGVVSLTPITFEGE